jgi:hypothetical protein
LTHLLLAHGPHGDGVERLARVNQAITQSDDFVAERAI